MALFEIKNMSFAYNGATGPAVEDVTLSVEEGDFVLLCGSSGCGKTTLLRLLKKELSPVGRLRGEMLYDGEMIGELDGRRSAAEIGYVMQNAEDQIVTDKVSRELAFGLESLGYGAELIRRRVAEVCGFFGIGDWYNRSVLELSGGQKQLLSLASVMTMEPRVIVLDEPTSQLDPIAASELIYHLRRINEELGITVIIAEHRLEELFVMANKVVVMRRGGIALCDAPKEIAKRLSVSEDGESLTLGLPAALRLFALLGGEGECPLSVRDGKRFIETNYGSGIRRLEVAREDKTGGAAIEIEGGYFRYQREEPDVLKELSVSIEEGAITCILGANGAGKTTLLKVLAGSRRLYRGRRRVFGGTGRGNGESSRVGIGYLPQDPKSVFVGETVREELTLAARAAQAEEAMSATERIIKELGLESLLDRHPYDLSGGEMQTLALARLLIADPRIILLDEPTKGLDALSKRNFARILMGLKKEGRTVVIVTHDAEFCAEYADRCAMFFDGRIVSCEDRITFFSTNRYYTTAAARITRPMYENAITVEMAAELCKKNGRKIDAE